MFGLEGNNYLATGSSNIKNVIDFFDYLKLLSLKESFSGLWTFIMCVLLVLNVNQPDVMNFHSFAGQQRWTT
jgi:hypothetical protein